MLVNLKFADITNFYEARKAFSSIIQYDAITRTKTIVNILL